MIFRYRKRAIYRAVQWNGRESNARLFELVNGRAAILIRPTETVLQTLRGDRTLTPGDWVVEDGAGSFSVRSDADFNAEYDHA